MWYESLWENSIINRACERIAMTHLKNLPVENIIHRTGGSPFSLHRTVVDAGESNALYLHCHPEAEFFYLKKGDVVFRVEQQSYHLHSGDAIFLPPNLIHKADRCGDLSAACEYYALVFSTHLLTDCTPVDRFGFFMPLQGNRMNCLCPLYAKEPQNARLLTSLSAVFEHLQQPPETFCLALTGTLFICWQELYNLYLSGTVKASSDRESFELQKSLDYMMAHYNEALSLSDLAKHAGFSEGYYCHSFKRFTGCSPFEYLIRVRIVKSCELLTQTDKKITEIASLCGFNNVSYFNRTFHRVMGTTPSAYRKSMRAKR